MQQILYIILWLSPISFGLPRIGLWALQVWKAVASYPSFNCQTETSYLAKQAVTTKQLQEDLSVIISFVQISLPPSLCLRFVSFCVFPISSVTDTFIFFPECIIVNCDTDCATETALVLPEQGIQTGKVELRQTAQSTSTRQVNWVNYSQWSSSLEFHLSNAQTPSFTEACV